MKSSTGLRAAMLSKSGNSFPNLMDGGTLKLYSGPVPVTADAAIDPSNHMLCEVFVGNDGVTGLSFETEPVVISTTTPPIVHISKNNAEVWSGTNSVTGEASFFRLELAADDQSQGLTHFRVQGTVAIVGADLDLSSTALVSGANQLINFFVVALPSL